MSNEIYFPISNRFISASLIKAIFDRFEVDNERAWKGYDKEIRNYNKLILSETIDKENRYLRYNNSTENDPDYSNKISIKQFYDLYIIKNKRIKLTF